MIAILHHIISITSVVFFLSSRNVGSEGLEDLITFFLLKNILCIGVDIWFPREQQKKLAALQLELEKARQEGFVPKLDSGTHTKKKLLAVIGIMTTFGRKNNRDAIRKAWMPTGMQSFFFRNLSNFFFN